MLIPHKDFGRLRLATFLPRADSTQLENWELRDRLWVGEALGFSEFLRLDDDPEVLRLLLLDLTQFPPKAAAAVLKRIGLPIEAGMSAAQLKTLLGRHVREKKFVAGQVTRDYLTRPPNPYRVSCTIRKDIGLTHVIIMVPPIGDEV